MKPNKEKSKTGQMLLKQSFIYGACKTTLIITAVCLLNLSILWLAQQLLHFHIF